MHGRRHCASFPEPLGKGGKVEVEIEIDNIGQGQQGQRCWARVARSMALDEDDSNGGRRGLRFRIK